MAAITNKLYEYRRIDIARDQLITDALTGAVIGIRTDQDQSMINGQTDNMSGMGSGLTALTGRNIFLGTGSQAIVAGGVTITSGSITCDGGELVAIAY